MTNNADHSTMFKAEANEEKFIRLLLPLYYALRQLSVAKQRATRYAGGQKKLYKKAPFEVQ